MKTFNEWFKVRLVEDVESDVEALAKYSKWIVSNPRLADIRTWVSMVKRLPSNIRGGFVLDMISSVGMAIDKLPRGDQAEAQRLVASVDDSTRVQNQMVARGYLPTMVQPWKFYTSEQLKEYLSNQRGENYPNLNFIRKIINMNEKH